MLCLPGGVTGVCTVCAASGIALAIAWIAARRVEREFILVVHHITSFRRPLWMLADGPALLRIVLHVEIARESFASRAALQADRCFVGHASAESNQMVALPLVRRKHRGIQFGMMLIEQFYSLGGGALAAVGKGDDPPHFLPAGSGWPGDGRGRNLGCRGLRQGRPHGSFGRDRDGRNRGLRGDTGGTR